MMSFISKKDLRIGRTEKYKAFRLMKYSKMDREEKMIDTVKIPPAQETTYREVKMGLLM